MIVIRVNINHEEDRTVIEKEEITNVFVIKNVFSERKFHIRESNIDIGNNMGIIIIITW